jgi:transposase
VLNFGSRQVYLATECCDMRWGVPRLSGWIESCDGIQPMAGDLFVFLGRDYRRVKILVWDVSGYWLCSKRLEAGRFIRPAMPSPVGRRPTVTLSAAELGMLLEGIQVHRATYSSHQRRDIRS